jgi:hypothetical protein
MPAPKPRHRRRTSDPNLEPGLAAATKRATRPKKRVPSPSSKSTRVGVKARTRAFLKRQKSVPSLLAKKATRKLGITNPTKPPKKKAPARTSDPNLEPGVASATRQSQAPKKRAPAKAVRKYALSAVPTKTGKRLAESKSERVSPRKKRAPAPPKRKPVIPRRRVNPRTMELMPPPAPRRKPATPKKRAPARRAARPRAARPRAAAPKRAKPAASRKR